MSPVLRSPIAAAPVRTGTMLPGAMPASITLSLITV
jgi:hypothetical protein